MTLEKALDLSPREAGGAGNRIQGQRPFDVLLHELRDLDEACVRDANLRLQRDVLPVFVVAHTIDDELFGDEISDARSELDADEMQHEIQRRDTAGAGVAVAIDGKELIADENARKLLAQRGEILPMDGGMVLIEESRACLLYTSRCV